MKTNSAAMTAAHEHRAKVNAAKRRAAYQEKKKRKLEKEKLEAAITKLDAVQEPLTISIPADGGFVVITRHTAEYLRHLLQAITHPRIRARGFAHNKADALLEALDRSAENAERALTLLGDSNVEPPPSPMYGVESDADKRTQEECNRACVINNSLHSAWYRANRKAES